MKILITGASRGIGAAMALYFQKRGHVVYSTSSKDFNFLDPKSPAKCFEMYQDAEVLINNAGYCEPFIREEQGIEAFENMMQVNFTAPCELALRFTQKWEKEEIKGRVINILSRVAKKGSTAAPHYAASKAALLNFTHSLGAMLAPKEITILGLSPSWVETDLLHNNAKDIEAERQALPIKRFLTPEEICSYARFLVEDDCRYLTGQTLDTNGASHF